MRLMTYLSSCRVAPAAVLAVVLSTLAAAGCEGPSMDQRIKSALATEPMKNIVSRIGSANPDERREALQAAAADRDTRNLPEVVKLFCAKARTDDDPLVRSAAVRGMGMMEGADVIPSLATVLARDGSPHVRTDAAAALGRQGKPECVAPLAASLKDEASSDVRVVVAESLRNFRDPVAGKALVTALADPSLAVNQRAWESLRYMTGQNLDREAAQWNDYLAQTADPFAAYGHPPPMPRDPSQRPHLIQGPADLFKNLFAKDPYEAELE
jgi:HEAT repeat protein